VAIVMRDVDHNNPFVRRMEEIQRAARGHLGVALGEAAHEKTIVGDDYVFGGSMNLTNYGLTANDEHMLLRVDPAAAARRRLTLHQRWEGALRWQ
jgi:phosphatidylserine/phosphatidylglycerophosphate/cardiolipin synthase-like enzyme